MAIKIHLLFDRPCEQNHDGKSIWTVRLEVNGQPKGNLRLEDPLKRSEYASFHAFYTGKRAIDESTSEWKEYVANTTERLELYRTMLFNQIDLNSYVVQGEQIEIFVRENHIPGPDSQSIHCLFWETLEDLATWNTKPTKVSVCRLIPRFSNESFCRSREGTHSKPFTLLLVVGRSYVKDKNNEFKDDAPIHAAQSPLLAIQKRLRREAKSKRLEIEIVRPGCLADLEKHLQSADPGYFDLVHFDLHGIMTTNDRGQWTGILRFADPSLSNGGYQDESADRIAELLDDHHIGAAVMTACCSADTRNGHEANTSMVFCNRGISAVVGMSFDASTTAIEVFCKAFYDALILKSALFRHACSHGRDAMRANCTAEGSILPVNYELLSSENHWTTSNAAILPSIRPWVDWFVCLLLTTVSAHLHLFCLLASINDFLCYKHWNGPTPPKKTFRVDMRTLELEYYLKKKGSIYLSDINRRCMEKMIRPMTDIWLWTNFIGSVQRVEAKQFGENWIWKFLRKLHSSIYGDRGLITRDPRPERNVRYTGRKRMIIIEDLDKLDADHLSKTAQEEAIDNLKFFLKSLGEVESYYLIIIGKWDEEWFGELLGVDATWLDIDYMRPFLHY